MSKVQDQCGATGNKGKRITALGLVFLGLGSVISGSFFLGSGIAVQMSGPSVVLGYLIGGVITYLVLVSLGHLALKYKDQESFRDYVYEAMGPTGGFMVGWVAWLTSIVGMVAESLAMAIYTRLWFPQIPMWILPIVYAILATIINFFGIKIVDKSEGFLTVIKTGALLAFTVVVAYVIFLTHRVTTGVGVANLTPLLPRGLGGLAQATVICTFAYGLGAFSAATGDTRCPRQDIPKATMGMAIGQMFFFAVPTFALMLAVPWTRISTTVSPFVTGLNHIGIHMAGAGLNAIVLLASFSALVAAMFSARIMLYSLAKAREAPAFFAVQWKEISIYALIVSLIAVLILAYVAMLLPKNIYNYAVSTAGYLSFVNWGFILLARLVLCLPRKNQGRLEWSGLTVTVLGLVALVAISLLSLEAPEQRFPFILTVISMVILLIVGKFALPVRKKNQSDEVVSETADTPPIWQRIGGKLRQK